MNYALTMRITGFFLSLIFTLLSYFIIINPGSFNLETKSAIITIFSFALAQSLVQLIFFISIWKEEGGEFWNLSVFISTASIIFVVIFFSIWIINHLNYNMRL